MALGIPIKMVVLTIVGMAGLAAMIAVIDNGEAAMPRPIHADIKSGNLIILSEFEDTEDIDLSIEVFDSTDGIPIRKASAVLSGLGATSVNITDNNGYSIVRFKKTDFNFKAGEGYLKLDIKSNGFQDYTNEYAVKIVK